MKNRIYSLLVPMLVSLTVVALLMGLGGSVMAQDPSPQTVASYNTVNWTVQRSITQTANGSAILTAGYGLADCYEIIDATLLQTVTVKLQHSSDSVNWVDLYSFPAASSDATVFTRTVLYGQYNRAIVSALGNTNPVSVTVQCVHKNNGG